MDKRSKLRADQFLMLTHTSEGQSYGLDNGKGLTTKAVRTMQGDLFVKPQEDGLFPGHSQTWKRVE